VRRKAMRTIRRRLEFTLSTGTKAMDLHQLSHALFASMNATRRKLTPDTWPAIGALHLIENRLEVNQKGHITDPAARLQWTSSSRLPRSMLAIAAGADFEHLALPRYWPDRSMSLDKGVSHRDSLAKYAVAFLRNGLLGGRHLCCLQNESEGLGTPMKIFDNPLPIAGLVI